MCNPIIPHLSGSDGQTGSGKTFTMTGGDSFQERGLIPRAISDVYESIGGTPDRKFKVLVCFSSAVVLERENFRLWNLRMALAMDIVHTVDKIDRPVTLLLLDSWLSHTLSFAQGQLRARPAGNSIHTDTFYPPSLCPQGPHLLHGDLQGERL